MGNDLPQIGPAGAARVQAFGALSRLVHNATEQFDRQRRTTIDGRLVMIAQGLAEIADARGWSVAVTIGDTTTTLHRSASRMRGRPRLRGVGTGLPLVVGAFDHDAREWVLSIHCGGGLQAFELEPVACALMLTAVDAVRPALAG